MTCKLVSITGAASIIERRTEDQVQAFDRVLWCFNDEVQLRTAPEAQQILVLSADMKATPAQANVPAVFILICN